MQSNGSGFGAVKEEALYRIFNIGAKLFPGVGLGHNVFSEAFGDKAAICFLGDLKHKISDRDGIHWALE